MAKHKFKVGDIVTWNKRPENVERRDKTIIEINEEEGYYEVSPAETSELFKDMVFRCIKFEKENEFDLVQAAPEPEEEPEPEFTDEEIAAAELRTFHYLHSHESRGVCPKCGKYIIIDGYICFGCGFDKSAYEWEKRHRN
jgi:hypothetical protein